MIHNITLRRLFQGTPFRGSFKPTRKMGEDIPSLEKATDFRYFNSHRAIQDKRIGSPAETTFGEIWPTSKKNRIVVVGRKVDTEDHKKTTRIFRKFNQEYGMAHVISMTGIPNEFNQTEDYAVEKRRINRETGMVRGTSNFALDFLLEPDKYRQAMDMFIEEPELANDLLIDIPTFYKGQRVHLYEAFILSGLKDPKPTLEQVTDKLTSGRSLREEGFETFAINVEDKLTGRDAEYLPHKYKK